MKRLEEIREEYAKTRGFESWEHLNGDCLYDNDLDAIATIYAREVAQASLDKAAKQAKTFKNSNGGSWLDASIKEESITNPNNIILI
ncbi:TPA: hypothetical protein ACG0AB_000754 [Elizabethkingia anophelis]